MITIEDIRVCKGYSGQDHLLTGSEGVDLIGREFRTVGHVRKAVAIAMERECEAAQLAPTMVTLRLANGDIREVKL